jgi:aminoacylase
MSGEHPAVTRFRDYLRCKAMHPNPDYSSSVEFLKRQADEIGLDFTFMSPCGDPIVILTWKGTDPTKQSVLLNSHMDVVSVFPEHWTYPPFSAHKTEDGKIYARGSQDMKCVGMQHLESVRRLKAAGKSLLRTLHLSFLPDEEAGGSKGMKAMIDTGAFTPLNIGFVLDEGLASGEDVDIIPVYYAERAAWTFDVICTGNPGHGSRFIENSAAEKFRKVLNSFLSFRDEQELKLSSNPSLGLGDVTTVNFTKVRGGVQYNVVPSEFVAGFNVRVTPHQNLEEFNKQVHSWVTEAGEGVSIKFLRQHMDQSKTDISSNSKWWLAFSKALKSKNVAFKPDIFSAATDSRHLRAVGLEALGFSYMPNTPILLHDNDEYLEEKVFLQGIEVFLEVISNIGNVD